MKSLNEMELKSMMEKIRKHFPLDGLLFNDPLNLSENNISYTVFERYNYQWRIIYVVVALNLNEQFNRLDELESIARKITENKDANFGCFFTCSFDNNEAGEISPKDNQIQRLKK